MDKIYLLLIGFSFAGGMVLMWFLMRAKIGNDYTIDADIKNKGGQMTDNIFEGKIEVEEPKKGLFKKRKEKRFFKKMNK